VIEIVLITGHLETGKTDLATRLSVEHGYSFFRTSKHVEEIFTARGEKEFHRVKLQQLGKTLDLETDSKWVYNHVSTLVEEGQKKIVVDHVRNNNQLAHFRQNPNWRTIHVHLYEPKDRLIEQYKERSVDEKLEYQVADPVESKEDIERFKEDADIRINTDRTDRTDTYIRVASRLRIFSNPDEKCVDVLIGGQFGSEGKGHIAASISKNYSMIVRVGGPNAGHTVSSSSGVYTYHQLPSGAKDCRAKLLLGPGMTIDKDKLLAEIADCGISPDRLCIDPQAILITEADKAAEEKNRTEIASTASGSGAAAARRIRERTSVPPMLAKDDPDLKVFTEKRQVFAGDAIAELELHYKKGAKVLLEGTQGSGLSIFNGQYPHVTSRDTNVAGCLAEVGISPKRVRRIIMVVRTTPIRVGDPDDDKFTSGHLKNSTTFKEIALKSGLNPEKVEAAEKTSTTNRPRKVGWFDWELFRRSCMINSPTDIALTFVDYLDAENAPVSIINTRFQRLQDNSDLRSMIDRRDWW